MIECLERGANGYRYYQEETLLKLELIQLLRSLGFMLDQIHPFVSSSKTNTKEDHVLNISELKNKTHKLEKIVDVFESLKDGESFFEIYKKS